MAGHRDLAASGEFDADVEARQFLVFVHPLLAYRIIVGCASPKFDPCRKAWGLTQRALAFARRFSPEGSELKSHGGLPIGRNTPVGNK